MNPLQLQMILAQMLRSAPKATSSFNAAMGSPGGAASLNAGLAGWDFGQSGTGQQYRQYADAINRDQRANGGIGAGGVTPQSRASWMPGQGMYSTPTNYTPGITNGVVRPYATAGGTPSGHDPWGRW